MPGFTFDTEEFQTRVDIHDGLTDELVAGISETLDEAGVPSVLWNEYLLTLYGVPTAIFGLDFVLPDEKITAGYEALRAVGFLPECSQNPSCLLAIVPKLPPPGRHLHLDSQKTLCLYKKSDMLWDVPSFEVEASNGMLTFASQAPVPHTDSRDRYAPFEPHLYPVRMPTVGCYIDALTELYILYDRQVRNWHIYRCYMGQYVAGSYIFDVETDIKPEFRPFWRVKTGRMDGDVKKEHAELRKLEPMVKKRRGIAQERAEQSEQNPSTAT